MSDVGAVSCRSVSQHWSVFQLADGTTLRIRPIVTRVQRNVDPETGEDSLVVTSHCEVEADVWRQTAATVVPFDREARP